MRNVSRAALASASAGVSSAEYPDVLVQMEVQLGIIANHPLQSLAMGSAKGTIATQRIRL
jgi:hypothetical protein